MPCFMSYSQLWSIQTMKHELELTVYFQSSLCHLQWALIHKHLGENQIMLQVCLEHSQELSLSFLLQLHFLRSWKAKSHLQEDILLWKSKKMFLVRGHRKITAGCLKELDQLIAVPIAQVIQMFFQHKMKDRLLICIKKWYSIKLSLPS